MRTSMIIILAAIFTLGACGGGQKKTTKKKPKTTMPADYQTWPQVSRVEEGESVRVFISPPDEEEMPGEGGSATVCSGQPDPMCAHEVFVKAVGELGEGSVLVKRVSTVVDGAVGEPVLVGVMRLGSGEENGGWQFEAYDAKTGARADLDVATCVSCHALSDNGAVHSVIDDLLTASPAAAASEGGDDEASDEAAPAEGEE